MTSRPRSRPRHRRLRWARRRLPWLALALGLLALVGAGWQWHGGAAVRQVGAVPLAAAPGLVAAASSPSGVEGPDSPPPDASVGDDAAGAGTPGAAPTGLDLPSLQVSAPVVPVGVEPGGALTVPDDPQLLGWWSDGALPGAATGSVVLDGHVDAATAGAGAFFRLRELAPGAGVAVRTAAGTVSYVVQAVRSYPKSALPADVFATAGQPRLVLITCGGAFDRSTRHYTDNVVVYALPAAGPASGPASGPGSSAIGAG